MELRGREEVVRSAKNLRKQMEVDLEAFAGKVRRDNMVEQTTTSRISFIPHSEGVCVG